MPKAELDITPLTLVDADSAYTIMQQVQPDSWSHGTFIEALNPPNQAWQVRLHAQAPCVGFYIVQTLMTPTFNEWSLEEIAVHPDCQSQGVGHVLMQHMLEQAHAQNVGEIFLEVRASNQRAQTLYLRHGFVIIDRRKQYYPGLLSALPDALPGTQSSAQQITLQAISKANLMTSNREDALVMRWQCSQ